MYDLYIADVYKPGAIFLSLIVWVYTSSPGKGYIGKNVRYGCSNSFKVIEIGTNRKPICDILLIFHCN